MDISSPKSAPKWLLTVLGPMLSGFVYVQAFAPVGWKPAVLLGLAGFLYCLRGLTAVEARRAGFLFGMIVMCVGCAWLKNIFGWLFIVLCAVHALFYALFGWGHAIIDRQLWSSWRKVFSIACVWTAVEFVRAEHFWLDFPWMTPGHGLGVIQVLTQPVLATIGVYGVGFVIVATCELLQAFARRFDRLAVQQVFGGIGIGIGLLGYVMCGWIVDEGNKWVSVQDIHLHKVSVAAIQAEHSSLPDFIAATKALTQHHDLIIWPEEALPFDVAKSKRDWPWLLALAKEKDCVLVTGTQQQEQGKEWRNTALTIDPSGELGRHYKMHPVHLFNDGTPGTEAKPIQTGLGKIGTPVCFDCDYEDVVRKMTAAGAELFAIPMMDPMDWGLTQRWMHSELFRIRAAENGRAMAICATSGVTQLIDTRGQLLWTAGEEPKPCVLEPMKPGVLTGSLALRSELTFYTRCGWLFPWCALVAGAGIIGVCCFRNERQA